MVMKPIKIIVPVGSLGAGAREQELQYGIEQGAHAIACDAGSTDSGAAYLAQGISKNSHGSVKRDLEILMQASRSACIPLVIGTSGQAGADSNVDWTLDIVEEVAEQLGYQPKIAILYSEVEREQIKSFIRAGKTNPLPPLGPLTPEIVDQCDRIVSVQGPEPYMKALREGADIIIGGRTTDTAVIACFALLAGANKGAAWHAAKIAECGAQCTALRNHGSGVLISVDDEGFEVEPLSANNYCSIESVSAHMLYENSDPFILVEPGGVLDVTHSSYVQKDERVVRVTGSNWVDKPYTLKLEGAGGGGYQTIMLIGIQDPDVTQDPDGFHDKLLDALYKRVNRTMGEAAGRFHISLRMYGWNGVSGLRPPAGTPPPRELGVLFVATAENQEVATQIAKSCNPYFFHFPVVPDKELPSYGFAFSPADIERGQVFEFKLNHVVEVDDPLALTRMKWINKGGAE